MIAVAPELPGADEAIEFLCEGGLVARVGHTGDTTSLRFAAGLHACSDSKVLT